LVTNSKTGQQASVNLGRDPLSGSAAFGDLLATGIEESRLLAFSFSLPGTG
jgi:hypothetical protein